MRSRVCLPTIGKRRHACEENRCSKCSFLNYFIDDPVLAEKDVAKFGSATTFKEDFGIDFLLDSLVEWYQYEQVGVDLPGKRKYDHLLFKT